MTSREKTMDQMKSIQPRHTVRRKEMLVTTAKWTVLGGLAAIILFFGLVLFLPLPQNTVPQATQVFDVKGRPVSSLFVENRIIVPSGDIPGALKAATVAMEDKRFYNHHGVDFGSLARALVKNIKARRVVEGGSTITQQLAKNLFLSHERTIQRKLMELVYTLKLEMRYSKDEILSMYLNQIYLGHGSYGCEVASRTYFGKSVKELSLSESALLAGVIRLPEYYSPYHDKQRSIDRRNLVLQFMVEQGRISQEQRETARAEQVKLAGLTESEAPYFISYVISQIRSRHPEVGSDIYRGGFTIYTTLDLDVQRAAEEAFATYILKGTKDAAGVTQPQGALVAIEPDTGFIKAMVGGRDWSETQLNRATQVARQPGSAFKILLYAAVIDKGHPITQTMVCEPVSFPGATKDRPYVPVDFGRHPYHYAPLDIRQAVAISDNVVAAKWAAEIGPEAIIEYARKMGIHTPLESSIPLALGTSEVIPLEMAVVAATLSAGGLRPEPLSILKLVDAKGRVIEENKVVRTPVLNPGTAYVLTNVLRSVLAPYGTGDGLQGFLGGRPAAGKTGTTDNQLEGWLVGYTRELACAVYVGHDDRDKSLPATGAAVAGPIWASFMGKALRNVPFREWEAPADVVWAEVCDDTGKLAGIFCPSTHYEVFLKWAMPERETRNHLLESLFPSLRPDNEELSHPSGQEARPVPVIRALEAPHAGRKPFEMPVEEPGEPSGEPSGEHDSPAQKPG